MSSDTESEVSSLEEEVPIEPETLLLNERKKKRLDQLAAARKKSLEVRKEKNEPKKKRIELQAQVNKQLYDVEVARVAELEKVLALSEKRNKNLEQKANKSCVSKQASKTLTTLLKHKPMKKVVEVSSEEEDGGQALTPQQDMARERAEFMMRQLYNA